MDKMEPIILLVLVMFIGGCLKIGDELKAARGPKGARRDIEDTRKAKGNGGLYRNIVPGLTIGKHTIGGIYVSVAADESVFKRMQDWLLVVAGVLFIVTLGGLAALYFGKTIGLDISILSGSFCALTALCAVYAKAFLISLGVGVLVMAAYWLYVLWRKHRDDKLHEVLVETVEVQKKMTWDEGGEKAVDNIAKPNWARKKIDKIRQKRKQS